MKKDHWLHLASAASGAAVWALVAFASGRKEAWDSDLYFLAGYPAVCLITMAFAFFAPQRWWRWGVLPFAGQFVWMLVTQGPGNLLPLGIVVFAVLSIPAVVAARIGAFTAAKIHPTRSASQDG